MSASVEVRIRVVESAGDGVPIRHGAYPEDGYLNGAYGWTGPVGWRWVRPELATGQRLSGAVTIGAVIVPYDGGPVAADSEAVLAGVEKRLIVDGVPQGAFATGLDPVVDTTEWDDGTHVIGVQVMSASYQLSHIARVLVFNNSGVPLASKANQAVVGHWWGSVNFTSLAWARVDVTDAVAYPLPHPTGHIHPPPTDADRERLATEAIWWLEGLHHQGTGLYSNFPMLVKNRHGDYFVRNWNPQGLSSSLASHPAAQSAPAFDGPRGICMVSPYSTLVPSERVLASGQTGWLGVDISGRVFDQDLNGEVTTIFGPRSVAGIVQTDPNLVDMTLAQRIAAGEKEFVGTGEHPVMPQDLSIKDSDIILLADTGANKMHRLSRSAQEIVSSVEIPDITSVWYGLGAEWATSLASGELWRNGAPVAAIPFAFWVRGDPTRNKIYVLTDFMEVYEVDPDSFVATKRNVGIPEGGHREFAFMAVDVNGTCGPLGRIYFSMVTSYDQNTGIHYMDPDVWVEQSWNPGISNAGNLFTSQQARVDKFGHYLWGLAFHGHEAMWVSWGMANSSYKVATAHLGQQPVLDEPMSADTFYMGEILFRGGIRDKHFGIGDIFGHFGAGGLGFSADELRFGTVEDFRAMLDPLLPAAYSSLERDQVAHYVWAQRSRGHFDNP